MSTIVRFGIGIASWRTCSWLVLRDLAEGFRGMKPVLQRTRLLSGRGAAFYFAKDASLSPAPRRSPCRSVTVFALPLRSAVLSAGSASTFSTARRIAAAASVSPRCSSIIARRPDLADRIGDPLARRCPAPSRAPARTTRGSALGIDVAGRRDADRPGAGRAQIGEDVAEQVGGDHHIEPVRVAARNAPSGCRCGICRHAHPG